MKRKGGGVLETQDHRWQPGAHEVALGGERQGAWRVDFYTEEFSLSLAGNSLTHVFTHSGCFQPSRGLGTWATEVSESPPPLGSQRLMV